jgi:hypothetical protein
MVGERVQRVDYLRGKERVRGHTKNPLLATVLDSPHWRFV